MIIQEEENNTPTKPILLVVLGVVLLFALYQSFKKGSETDPPSQEQEKEILLASIEPFWKPAKEIVNQVNLEAETYIAINKLEPREALSSEIFFKKGHKILSKIDGHEEQIITWKGTTDDELQYPIIGRIYLSGWTPKEGESYAYATLEVLAPDNTIKVERIYPIDESSQLKKERMKKIEAGESLPPPTN